MMEKEDRFGLRLDKQTKVKLTHIAVVENVSKSEVVRLLINKAVNDPPLLSESKNKQSEIKVIFMDNSDQQYWNDPQEKELENLREFIEEQESPEYWAACENDEIRDTSIIRPRYLLLISKEIAEEHLSNFERGKCKYLNQNAIRLSPIDNSNCVLEIKPSFYNVLDPGGLWDFVDYSDDLMSLLEYFKKIKILRRIKESETRGRPKISGEELKYRLEKAEEAEKIKNNNPEKTWREICVQINWRYGSSPAGIKTLEDSLSLVRLLNKLW